MRATRAPRLSNDSSEKERCGKEECNTYPRFGSLSFSLPLSVHLDPAEGDLGGAGAEMRLLRLFCRDARVRSRADVA